MKTSISNSVNSWNVDRVVRVFAKFGVLYFLGLIIFYLVKNPTVFHFYLPNGSLSPNYHWIAQLVINMFGYFFFVASVAVFLWNIEDNKRLNAAQREDSGLRALLGFVFGLIITAFIFIFYHNLFMPPSFSMLVLPELITFIVIACLADAIPNSRRTYSTMLYSLIFGYCFFMGFFLGFLEAVVLLVTLISLAWILVLIIRIIFYSPTMWKKIWNRIITFFKWWIK